MQVARPAREVASTVGQSKPNRSELSPLSGETVLVVEDQASIRELLRMQLSRDGCTVLTAGNGREGLDMILGHDEIGVVVSDVVMPTMSGPAMVDEARRHRPRLGVVFMSGYSDRAQPCPSMREQGTVFLDKPFTHSELQRAVRAALVRMGHEK